MRPLGSRPLPSSCALSPLGLLSCPAHTRCHGIDVAGRIRVMGQIDAHGNAHDAAGKFDGRIRIDPERSLAEELAQLPGLSNIPFTNSEKSLNPLRPHPSAQEQLTWVVQGDDHETRLIEAESSEAAAEYAAAEFSAQYGEEIDPETMCVLGAFHGSSEDVGEEDFVDMEGMDRDTAVYALRQAD